MIKQTAMVGIAMLASACGGGSGGSAPPPGPGPGDGLLETEARFSGTVQNAAGAPAPNVRVSLPYRNGTYSANTDSAGQYTFKVRVADFAPSGMIALRAYADGFVPAAFYYQLPLQGKSTYALGATPARLACTTWSGKWSTTPSTRRWPATPTP